MKRIIYIIVAFGMLLTLVSCGKKNGMESENNVNLTAESIITAENVKEIVTYETSATTENTHSKSVVRYDSVPRGQDPVIVELYSDKENASKVYDEFKKRKEKRPKAQDVTDLGVEAYIAYPSVNLYRDGYRIVITAGSGADEAQSEILKKAAEIAVKNLNEYFMQHSDEKET